jgi:hypothetical protein
MIILFDNSLFFSIDCMLIHAMFFHFLLFLLEKGRKATKRRTKRRTSTREGSPSGQPNMQPSTSRGGTSWFIVKFSLFLLILYFIP